ncbi:COMM domain-containing protein 2-like [Diorhabda carinulata]|uniref:COMM domain-containing protein 2-like n=1 Tax=Diorhabda carinulata TaxID=1163345 RepID=UPI0025A082A8|nr:COMM domain-containing protein 2-like [Diorhabda carinulata]
MLISLKKTHKEHLHFLTLQQVEIVEDFCTLATDFVDNGPNLENYTALSKKLEVETDVIQNCIYGITQLLLLSCKHKLSDADFRDSILTLGFSSDQQVVLSNLYSAKQDEIHAVLEVSISEPHYDDLRWRFEAQVSSRSLLNHVVPVITIELTTKTNVDGTVETEKCNLQTDQNNLLHIINELERALSESKSRHSRKIQRALKN